MCDFCDALESWKRAKGVDVQHPDRPEDKYLHEMSVALVAEKVDEIKASITEQEIIRCKDCKHWVMALPDIGCCQNIRHAEAIWWLGDDFCSRAERREE